MAGVQEGAHKYDSFIDNFIDSFQPINNNTTVALLKLHVFPENADALSDKHMRRHVSCISKCCGGCAPGGQLGHQVRGDSGQAARLRQLEEMLGEPEEGDLCQPLRQSGRVSERAAQPVPQAVVTGAVQRFATGQ
jgi:hypothetical protein